MKIKVYETVSAEYYLCDFCKERTGGQKDITHIKKIGEVIYSFHDDCLIDHLNKFIKDK